MSSRQKRSVPEPVFAPDIEGGALGVGNGETPPRRKPVAHIVVGFIGSGKTTFARRLEEETGAVRFTKDEWMVRLFGNTPPKDTFEEHDNKMASLARDMALRCLRAGLDIILDEGFWAREQRDDIRERVKAAGAIPRMYYLKVPLEIMKARTLRRTEDPPVDSYSIDEESFDHYWQFFQPPGEDEDFTLLEWVSDTCGGGHPG